jgi:hypothetical protein
MANNSMIAGRMSSVRYAYEIVVVGSPSNVQLYGRCCRYSGDPNGAVSVWGMGGIDREHYEDNLCRARRQTDISVCRLRPTIIERVATSNAIRDTFGDVGASSLHYLRVGTYNEIQVPSKNAGPSRMEWQCCNVAWGSPVL